MNLKKSADQFKTHFGHLIGMTAKAMKSNISRSLSEAGYEITADQGIIMAHLFHGIKLSQQQISDFLDRGKTYATRTIDALEEKKLVRRIVDKNDRRQNSIVLTQTGRKLCGKLKRIVEKRQIEAVKGIDRDEIEITRNVLIKVLENISI